MFSRPLARTANGFLSKVTFGPQHRFATSAVVTELQDKIQALAKKKTPDFMKLRKEKGQVKIADVTVETAMLGMKATPLMVCETSMLDPKVGVKYRGYTLKECNEKLPKWGSSKIGLPEASYWLLLTGEIPTDAQVKALNAELHKREALPQSVIDLIDGLGKDVHPMTQLSMGLLALQPGSLFAKKYREGVNKAELWKFVLEDSLDLVAKIVPLSARIFRNVFFDGKHIPSDSSMDWAGNYAKMLGVNDDPGFIDVTRLYLMLHADHEGGNVSAHTTHLVGSALADPYLAFSSGVNGLAGPLHGLANQECLKWLKATKASLGDTEPTVEVMTKFAQDTLAAGKVIPGFGHGALRITDPRYTIQSEFAQENFPDDPLFKLAKVCFQAIPPALIATGKVKSPWPNVDALSGCCMSKYGLTQEDYYTVIFAVSRALGCTANLVWSRVMGMPIERPKSVTLDYLLEKTA
jgi:citrate synthase